MLAEHIFRTREHLQYCKEHGIHLNVLRPGKPLAAVVVHGLHDECGYCRRLVGAGLPDGMGEWNAVVHREWDLLVFLLLFSVLDIYIFCLKYKGGPSFRSALAMKNRTDEDVMKLRLTGFEGSLPL